METPPYGKRRLADVNVTSAAAGKRATATNGFRVNPALNGSNGVRFRQKKPYLHHISDFPVGGLESGNRDIVAAGDRATVQDGAGCGLKGGFFGFHFVGVMDGSEKKIPFNFCRIQTKR
jgi:hypothetical protein